MLLYLIAPEVVTIAAISDWFEARLCTRECKDAGLSSSTMSHSFLVCMNCMRLISNSCTLAVTTEACSCDVPLTRNTLLELHTKDQLPREVADLTVEDVTERSTADGLVKAIATLQTLWFVAQCIGRAAQGLHITALEIVTLG